MIAFVLATAITLTPFQQAPQSKPTPPIPEIKGPVASTDPITLKRVYATTDDDTYILSAEIEAGASQSIDAEIKAKVLKLIDDKKASVELSAKEVKGSDSDNPPPDKLTLNMDERGMGDSFPHDGAQIVYSMFEVAVVVPGSSLKVGEEFKFQYQFSEGGTVSGSGKITEVKEVDGKKVAHLEWKGSVNPGGPEIGLTTKSDVDVATGKIIISRVTLDGGPVTGSIKVEAKKKA